MNCLTEYHVIKHKSFILSELLQVIKELQPVSLIPIKNETIAIILLQYYQ